ncbi:Regulatory protein AtoC [Koleobacter methoxysyntrophicus]|uniref:HTH-type transcriptional regulatory protein TyrR n=1 Tax=Koleobacter methoxysyntrophicus TaxID=2751313 RepID=A0A8A0RNW0_9FIRM|nr:sigma 54-interacting transcriptional regulator [Koleobacter methoxysyntrophicus]QSQ09268.1 Regulatory protein AtoC [Koleobacter methoxysyntrophicus]
MQYLERFLDEIPFGFFIIYSNNRISYANKKGKFFLKDPKNKSYIENLIKKFNGIKKKITTNKKEFVIEIFKMEGPEGDRDFYCVLVYDDDHVTNLFFNTETSDEYKAILDSIQDAVFIDDEHGNTLWINKACERLYRIERKNVIGKSSDKLEEMGVLNPSVAKLVIKEKKQVSILQNTKYGKKLLITGTPIQDNNGIIRKIVSTSRDITELVHLKNELEVVSKELDELRHKHFDLEGFVVKSKEMQNLMHLVNKLALIDTTVLICGESGVGKGEIAKYIHKSGKRKDKPFITINCGAIPELLLESELFGYEPGAFTGSSREGKMGLFEVAHQGTIFLDEVAELPLNLQVKILQVIQDKEFKRVGGLKPIKTDVRIIAATNKDLKKMVDENRFREDLYYRLNVVPIHIPALRERKEDIIPLINYFLAEQNKKYGVLKRIDSSAMNCLVKYSWPGNVRELKNIIERLVITASDDVITIEHLPGFIVEHTEPNSSINVNGIIKLKDAVKEIEKQIIKRAIAKYKTTRKAAQVLGVSQPTIVRKMKKYRIVDT